MQEVNSQELSSTPAAEDSSVAHRLEDVFEQCYAEAEQLVKSEDYTQIEEKIGAATLDKAKRMSCIRHASRGVALTLCAFKIISPSQDIRRHKADHEGGFSARSYDTKVTVPFLQNKNLSYNVETHWLSQTFSFAGPYVRGVEVRTQPRAGGILLVDLVNDVEEAANPVDFARAVVNVLMAGLIEERNKGKILLEKPKELPINVVIEILDQHFHHRYSKNAPRLPQLAIYAIYSCIVPSMSRYEGLTLQPIERLKTANRKSGSVGDIDVNREKQPTEAVEVKFDVPITESVVREAIQKIRHESVSRYLILSTADLNPEEAKKIKIICDEFRRSNGCEIIVNGVLETIKYYLRLIPTTNDFVFAYTSIVQEDPDLTYEHKQAWNDVCQRILGQPQG